SQCHAAHVSRTGRADQAQITPEFIIQVELSDSRRGGRLELESLHVTAISHDRKVGHVNEVAFRILPTAGFHPEQSSHGRTRAAVNPNARTTHSLQKSCSCYLLSKRVGAVISIARQAEQASYNEPTRFVCRRV